MDNNTIIADVLSKLISSGGSVAAMFITWFAWNAFKIVKSIHDSFEKIVQSADAIKEQNDTLLVETTKIRAALEADGYAIRTAPFRRFRQNQSD